MTYKLEKPITDKQRADFIVEYNHNQGLRIEDGSDTYSIEELTFKADYIFALEPNEMMAEEEVEIDVPDEVEEEQTYHKETVIVYKPVIDPNWDEEQLQKAKESKYNEANKGAKEYLDGNALYEFEEGKHIEATDGNIAKFTAYALAYITGQLAPTDTVVWNTKEDETVELNQEQVIAILNGLGQVQAYIWAVKFPYYIRLIESAQNVEEVELIIIDYTLPIEEVEK